MVKNQKIPSKYIKNRKKRMISVTPYEPSINLITYKTELNYLITYKTELNYLITYKTELNGIIYLTDSPRLNMTS